MRTSKKPIETFFILLCSLLVLNSTAQESDCGNGLDDDNDGFIDCGDTDCYGSSTCDDAFTCTNTLYQVVSRTLNRLDPLTGKYESLGEASANYNGAGFNVQDGYIYGIKSSSDGKHLWRINNSGKETDLGVIAGFSGRTYVGDFDDKGNLYTYNSGSNATLSYVDVDSDMPKSVVTQLIRQNGVAAPSAADITYNPKFKKFYGLSSSHELFELDPEASTMKILGDFSSSIEVSGSFGAAWSDQTGYSYFANNNTGKIFRFTFGESGEVLKTEYVATGQPTNSNDGMGCFFSLPPFETSCTDGIDNDGDGLTDCDDPDCVSTGICPAIDIELRSIDLAGPLSIVPFHLQMVNNSSADALDFIIKAQMPDGFSFLSDTLEYSTNSSFTNAQQPVEGIRNTLIWDGLSIPLGDTIMISFSVLVDQSIANGTYDFLIESMGVVQSPYSLTHPIDIDESIYFGVESYECEPAFYQVYKKRGEPNVLGKLNPQSAEYDKIAIIDHQANGLGYDIESGYAYGSDGKKFIRIDPEGNVVYQGFEFEKNVYVGDVNEAGLWYGKVGGDMVKVNIEANQIEATYPGQGMPGWDMAYNNDGQFYAVHGQTLYQFNTTSNTKQVIGQLTGDEVPTSGHGAQWTGIDGYHYISNNKTGQIYRINVDTKDATLCMVSESNLQFNDGFACPTELPVVFQYDYGDNINMPIARQLVYEQDLGNDDVPDYAMVWLGAGVSHETLDPSDETASGDSKDDGFKMEDIFSEGEINNATIILNTNRADSEAHWGIWFDWDQDGQAEQYYSGQATISGTTEVEIPITIPAGISGSRIAIRVRTSVNEIKEENFAGDIYEPGEVEDYIITIDNTEICANGIDDDKDGLLDCDDTECVDKCKSGETGSAGNGGLESNERLNDKITKSLFQSRMRGQATELSRRGLSRFQQTYNRAVGPLQLSDLIPVDKIPGTQTYINSPQHLINLTNAVDLFAVDVFENDKRVAAMLSLETIDGVYEHTKYICDRLTGSKVLDIFKYKIDDTNEFIIAKLELPDGNIEYSVSFSIRETSDGHMNLESYWNLGDYTKDTRFMNFQIWANNTSNLFSLTTGIIDLIKQKATIDKYLIGDAPSVFVKSGSIDKGNLHLNIVNKIGVDYLETAGNFSLTETMEQTDYNNVIQLSGALNEEITLVVGDVYYMGLAFYHPDFQVEDEIFLANGAWGYSIEGAQEEVTHYEVMPTTFMNDESYEIERAITASGQVRDFITFYRSFNPRFSSKDLDNYNSLIFKAKGNATLEVSVLKEGISTWQEQSKMVITLTPEEQTYILGKSFFVNKLNIIPSWEDAYMIVVNVLGDNEQKKPFDILLKDMRFGHPQTESSYVICSDQNIIGTTENQHSANVTDGTNMGLVEKETGFAGVSLPLSIANTGTASLIVDEVEIIDDSGAFTIGNFEPSEVQAGDSLNFEVSYLPKEINQQADIILNISMILDGQLIVVPVNIKAQSACPINEHVSTDDIAQLVVGQTVVKESASSDAIINNMQTLSLTAGQSITLSEGFQIESGGQLQLILADKCTIQE